MREEYKDSEGRIWVTSELLQFGPYGGGSTIAAANILWLEETVEDLISFNSNILYLFDESEHTMDEEKILDRIAHPEDYDTTKVLIFPTMGGGKIAYIRMGIDSDLDEAVNALADYPVFNEDYVYTIEAEWREEARPDIQWELMNMLSDEFENFDNWLESRSYKAGFTNNVVNTWRQALDEWCIEKFHVEDGLFEAAFKNAIEFCDSWEYEYDSAWINPSKVYDEFKRAVFDLIREYFCRPGTWMHRRKLMQNARPKLI